MTMPAAMSTVTRERLLLALRVVFLAAVVAFAWLGLRGHWHEIGDALADTTWWGALLALLFVAAGLLGTGLLWLRLMALLDARLPVVDGLAIFFLGQLGKYIPGSIWSLGAQADLARRHKAPARVTVTAGLVFLGYNVATAVVLAAVTVLAGGLELDWPRWLVVVFLLAAVVGLAPPVVRFLARLIGGRAMRLGWVDTVACSGLMVATWAAYAVALVLLVPDMPWSHFWALGGAFVAAYAVGVVIVFAPAGAGAREVAFVFLLEPLLGVGEATALALLARVLSTAGDVITASVSWAVARRVRARSSDASRG